MVEKEYDAAIRFVDTGVHAYDAGYSIYGIVNRGSRYE